METEKFFNKNAEENIENIGTAPIVSANEDGQVTLSKLEYLELKKRSIECSYLYSKNQLKNKKNGLYKEILNNRRMIYFFISAVSIFSVFLYFYGLDLIYRLCFNEPFEDFWDYLTIIMPVFMAISLGVSIVFLVKTLKASKYNMNQIELCDYESNRLNENHITNDEYIEITERIYELKMK